MAHIKVPDRRHRTTIGQKWQRGWNNDTEGDCQENDECLPFHGSVIIYRNNERCQSIIFSLAAKETMGRIVTENNFVCFASLPTGRVVISFQWLF